MGNGSRVTTACLSPPFRSSQMAYCYTDGFVCAGATYLCRATLWRVTTHDTYEFRYSVPFIFAAPFYHNALTNRAALLCRALRRVARLCSRMVSDTVNTRIHGRPTAVLRKKNPLPFPHSLSSANFAVLSQKETGFTRVETLVSILVPPPGRRPPRWPQRNHLKTRNRIYKEKTL